MSALAPQRSSRFATTIATVTAIVGLIYGYDNGSISGALPFLTKQFDLSSTMQGAVTSVTVVGSIVGAIFGGRLADRIGRKRAMLYIALGFGVFALLSGIPISIWWLLPMRFGLGLCIGTSIVVAPMFIGEFAPANIRGSLLVGFQIAQTIGIISANFVGYGLSFSGNWEVMLGVACIPAFLVAGVLVRFPDTPRWYVLKGMRDKAISELRRIEPSDNVDTRLAEIDADLASSEGKIRELFTKRFARATIFVIGFGFFVQITGINAIIYYAPIIFHTIGLPITKSILISAIIQITSFVAEVVAFFIVDRAGRRPTLLIGVTAMAVASAVLSALFFADSFHGPGVYLAFAAVMVFNMAFNFSLGSLVWVYASECYPAKLRGAGSSLLLTSDLVANLIVAQVFLIALHSVGGGWTFGTFMVLALCAWAFIFVLAPETKGRSLEEIRDYWDNAGRWSTEEPSRR